MSLASLEGFIHNICWYDIDDDGKLWSGRKKPLKPLPAAVLEESIKELKEIS